MITLKFIPNIFNNRERKEKQYKFTPNHSALYYLSKTKWTLKGKRIILSGKRIIDLDEIIKDNDEIIIITEIEGWIGAIIAAFKPIFTVIYWTAVVASVGYSIYSAVRGIRKPTNVIDGGIDEGNPVYAWDGVKTTQDSGLPIPIIYGEHKVGGNIINQFIRYDGDKNYLNVLLALCVGEVESISDIKINGNPIANFDGVSYTTRVGDNDQAVISGFELQHNLYVVNVELNSNLSNHIYTTIDSDVEGFEVQLKFPHGIFEIDTSNGALKDWSVGYRVEYKLHSVSEYINLGTTVITAKNRTALHRMYRVVGLTAGQYDIRITRNSSASDSTHEGNMTLLRIDELKNGDFSYPGIALLAIEALATEQLSGDVSDFSCIVKGRKVSIPKVMYGGLEVDWEDYYWNTSTSQYKRFVDDATCSWDSTTYVNKYSGNPIWCIKDLFSNTRYGLGEYIDLTLLSDSLALTESRYCENRVPDGKGSYEKRFRLDVVLASYVSALDAIMQLCASYRGFPFCAEGIKIDKEETPVQIFSMGNIIPNSFNQEWKSIKEVYNVIEVQFLDKDKDYEQETVFVIDEDALAAGDVWRVYQMRVFTTSVSQAIRIGRYFLWLGKYINRSISFKAGIDAIAIQPGDVFSFSHDVPQWGFSGRVVSGLVGQVTLDQNITFDAGKEYKLRIQFADDTVEEQTVSNSPGTTNIITVISNFTQAPTSYDKYAIGQTNYVKKDFRCISIKIGNDLICEILGVEYNESIYSDSGIALPTSNFSLLDLSIPNVENLKLTERLVKLKDGTIENAIDVWFEKAQQSLYVRSGGKTKIYISHDGVNYKAVGETAGNHFQIVGDIVDTFTYYVKIVSMGWDGKEGVFLTAPSSSITIIGKVASPIDVSSFIVNRTKNKMRFSWTHISDVDLWYYEIRLGSAWDGGKIVVTGVKANQYLTSDFKIGTDQKFWIKAVDTSGNYSKNATEGMVTVDDIPFENIINEYSEQSTWLGDKSNTVISGGNLIISSGYLTGTYITSIKDQSYVATFGLRVDIIVTIAQSLTFASDPTRKFNDDPTLRFSGSEAPGAWSLRIRISDDNITWSEWRKYQQGDYKCRYYQLELTLTRELVGANLQCSTFNHVADLPDISEFIEDEVTVAADGKNVIFANTYHDTTRLQMDVDIRSGDGYVWKITSFDLVGATIKLYDLSGVAKTGEFKLKVLGV